MDEFTMQVVLAVAMFVTTAIAGFAPFKLIKMITSNGVMTRRTAMIMSVLSCYAGGVFLATCFLDTLPHLNENFQKFKRVASWNTFYPLPEFIVCVGILLVYILEEVFARLLSKTNKGGVAKEMEVMKLANGKQRTLQQETEPLEVFQTIVTEDKEHCNGITLDSDAEVPRRSRSNTVLATSIIHSVTFTVAMSFHSILEGVALGVQDEKIGIITLFVSLLLHKGIESFSVGLQITRTIAQQVKMVVVTITIYSLMTPIGSIAGLFLQNANIGEIWRHGAIVVLEALAIGAFIFVTFLEVLSEQRSDPKAVTKELIAIALGVLTISGFQYFEQAIRDTEQNPNSDSTSHTLL